MFTYFAKITLLHMKFDNQNKVLRRHTDDVMRSRRGVFDVHFDTASKQASKQDLGEILELECLASKCALTVCEQEGGPLYFCNIAR